jgi:hypothetical protein
MTVSPVRNLHDRFSDLTAQARLSTGRHRMATPRGCRRSCTYVSILGATRRPARDETQSARPLHRPSSSHLRTAGRPRCRAQRLRTRQRLLVEYCILPLIGPTCCLLYRHVAPLILAAHHAEVALTDLARNLGLGTNIGPNSAVVKALARLEAFHIGAWRPDNQYALRRAVAPLTDRQAQRLPRLARTIHFQTVISGGSARSGSATPSSEAPDR